MPLPSTCPGCNAAVPSDLPEGGKCPWCGHAFEEVVDLGESEVVPEPANPSPSDATLFDLTPNLDAASLPEPKTARRVTTPEPPTRPRPPEDRDEAPAARRPRSRPVRRFEDDDELPRSHKPEKKSGGSKTLLIVALVSVALLFSCGGLAVLGYWLYPQSSDQVTTVTTAPRQQNFAVRDLNNPVFPNRQQWDRGWANLVQADGFSVRLPIGASGGPHTTTIDGQKVTGHEYEIGEASLKYKVEWYDLPAEITHPPATLVRQHREANAPPFKLLTGPTVTRLGQGSAIEFVYGGSAGQKETIRSARYGDRWFLFTVTNDPNVQSDYAGLDPDAKQRDFFDSVRITFRPSPPSQTSKETRVTKKEKSKERFKESPSPTQPTLSLDSIRSVVRHTAAVYLPQKKELLLFTTRDNTPGGGLIQRYTAPSFQSSGQRQLSNLVSYAVADERAGKLYAATYKAGPGADPRERLDAVGDIQVFDLNAVLSTDAPQPGGLPHTATHKLGAKVTALELAPDGQSLYATVIMPPEGLPAKPKSKLIKLALPALTPAGEAELPAPVLGARLSPDGKYLFAFEHPFNQVGQPVFGTGATASIQVIDAASLKTVRSVLLPGLPSDLRFHAPDRATVVVTTANRPKLFAVGVTGEPMDVTPEGGLKSLQAGYLGFANGRLVTSARIPGTTGTEVLTVEPRGPLKSVAFAMVLGSSTLSGPVTMTPDGRFAVFAAGNVVEIRSEK